MKDSTNFKEIITKTLQHKCPMDLSLPEYSLAMNHEHYSKYLVDDPEGSGLYYSFLHNVVTDLRPKNIVELGNREGTSTLMMLVAKEDEQQLTTIDINADLRFLSAEQKNKPNFRSIVGSSINEGVVNSVPNEIDFLFIDTLHTYGQICREWELWSPKLADGAIVAADDINYTAGGGRKIDDFIDVIKHHDWVNEKKLHGSGFLVFRYTKS